MIQGNQLDNYIKWLYGLAERGGKGRVDNIDARSLKRIADTLGEYHDLVSYIRDEIKEMDWEEPRYFEEVLKNIELKVSKVWNARTDN